MGRDQKKTADTHGATITSGHRQRQPTMHRGDAYEENPSMKRCSVCEEDHSTLECTTLARLEPDARVKKMMECGCCLNCGQKHHRARDCGQPSAKCGVCLRNHPSILHGRSFPQPAPRLSANDSEEQIAEVELTQ